MHKQKKKTSQTIRQGIIITALVIASAISLYSYFSWRSVRQELNEINEAHQALQNEYSLTADHLKQVLQAGMRKIDLQGTTLAPNSKAVVFWNPQLQETYLSVISLPKPQKNKQYQLWSFKEEIPSSAGLLALDTEKLELMDIVIDADKFGITLEPLGGSSSPSLDQLFLVGKLSRVRSSND